VIIIFTPFTCTFDSFLFCNIFVANVVVVYTDSQSTYQVPSSAVYPVKCKNGCNWCEAILLETMLPNQLYGLLMLANNGVGNIVIQLKCMWPTNHNMMAHVEGSKEAGIERVHPGKCTCTTE